MVTEPSTGLGPDAAAPTRRDARSSGRAFLLGGLLPALMLPTLGVLLYSSTGKDDSYLTFLARAHAGQLRRDRQLQRRTARTVLEPLHTLVLAAGTWGSESTSPRSAISSALPRASRSCCWSGPSRRARPVRGMDVGGARGDVDVDRVLGAERDGDDPGRGVAAGHGVHDRAVRDRTRRSRARRRLVPAAVLALAYVMVRPESGAVLLCALAALAWPDWPSAAAPAGGGSPGERPGWG